MEIRWSETGTRFQRTLSCWGVYDITENCILFETLEEDLTEHKCDSHQENFLFGTLGDQRCTISDITPEMVGS